MLEKLFSSPSYAIAQIIGFAATALALFIYSFRSRKKILLSKLTANVCWAFHYALIGQYPAAIINSIGIVRETLFYNRLKYKWTSLPIWPAFFIALNICSSFITQNGEFSPISLLPVIGSSIAVIGLWCKNLLIIRLINLPALTMWLIYSFLIDSPASIVCNIFSVTSLLIGLSGDLLSLKRNPAPTFSEEKVGKETFEKK